MLIGAVCGLAIGAGAAFLHLNVRGLVVFGLVLTPTVSGVVIGSFVGLAIGLIAAARLYRPS